MHICFSKNHLCAGSDHHILPSSFQCCFSPNFKVNKCKCLARPRVSKALKAISPLDAAIIVTTASDSLEVPPTDQYFIAEQQTCP